MKRLTHLLASVLAMVMIFTMSVYATEVDNDSTLTSMTITQVLSTGEEKNVEFSPAFDAQVKNYTATLDADCVELKFTVQTGSENAKAETYWTNIDPGENTSGVKVTAADGSTREYVLNSTRPDMDETTTAEETSGEETTAEEITEAVSDPKPVGELTVDVNGKTYTILSVDASMKIPAGFATESYEYDGNTITALKSTDSAVTCMYLANEQGKQGLFTYNETKKTFGRAVTVTANGDELTVVSLDATAKMPTGYTETTAKVSKRAVKAYTLGNGSSYYLVYGVDKEGTTGLYSYNEADGTFQAFNEVDYGNNAGVDATNLDNLQKKYNDLTDSSNKDARTKLIIILVLGILLLASLFLILHLILKLKELPEKNEADAELYDDDDIEYEEEDEEDYDEDDSEPEGDTNDAEEYEEKDTFEKSKGQDDGYDISYMDSDTVSIPDITPELMKEVKQTEQPGEEELAKSIQDVMKQDKEEEVFDDQPTRELKDKLNIDLKDSILDKLNKESQKIGKKSKEVDKMIPDFDTSDIPTMPSFDMDLSGLTDDDDDDFEFFDFDDHKK